VSQYVIIDLAIDRDCVQGIQPSDFEDDPMFQNFALYPSGC